jgi:hypothetical protein
MPCISFKHVKSHIKNIRRFKQWASRCKMVGNGFNCFANKFVTLSKLIAVFTPRIANAKIGVLWTAKIRWLNLRAECHGPDSSAVFNRTAAVRSNHYHQSSSRGGVQI